MANENKAIEPKKPETKTETETPKLELTPEQKEVKDFEDSERKKQLVSLPGGETLIKKKLSAMVMHAFDTSPALFDNMFNKEIRFCSRKEKQAIKMHLLNLASNMN